MTKRIELQIEGKLWLKQFIVGDSKMIFDLIDRNRKHLSQFDDDTAKKYQTLQDVIDSIEKPNNPSKIRLGIWDGELYVGTINLTPIEIDKRIEVGYYLGEEFEGKGYIQRALKIVVEFALYELEYQEIFANVNSRNEKSKNSLRKVGFQFDETESEREILYLHIKK